MSLPRQRKADKIEQKAKTPNTATATVVMTILVGKETINVTKEDLKSPERTKSIRTSAADSEDQCAKIQLKLKLLTLSSRARWNVLQFIAALGRWVKIARAKSKAFHSNVLDFVLSLATADLDLEHKKRARLAALEAAVLLHPTGLELACEEIAEKLAKAGVKGTKKRDLVRDARAILDNLGEGQGAPAESQKTVKAIVKDAPVCDSIVVPTGWSLTAAGVTYVGNDERISGFIPAPVLIVGRMKDAARECELVELAWLRDGHWRTTTVDRDVIAARQSIVGLAGKGVPVTSNTATTLIQFLSDYEAANLKRLPCMVATSQMGWHRVNDRDVFVLGNSVVTETEIIVPEVDGPAQIADMASAPICFRGSDEGDDQSAKGFHSAGTFENWKAAIAAIRPFRRVRLILYAAFVPILLRILESPNFVVSLAGPTTTGKTRSLMVAASVYGNPNMSGAKETATAMSSWDGTAVSRERASTVLQNVPCILDDTKHVRDREDVAKFIYAVTQGRSRARGTTKGLARQFTWKTVLFMSGEQPATSFTGDGGTRARVIEQWGPPFEAQNEAARQLIDALENSLIANYGHAGPLFIQAIIKNQRRWPAWKKLYRKQVNRYAARAAGNPVAGRMAAYFAAIWMAARLAHEFLVLPWEFEDPIVPLFDALTANAGEADRAAAALRYAFNWAVTNSTRFYARHSGNLKPPPQGWAGNWRRPDDDQWVRLGFLPQVLDEALRAGGFEPDSTLRSWRDRGWLMVELDSDGSRRTRIRAQVGDVRNVRIVAINRSAIDSVCNE